MKKCENCKKSNFEILPNRLCQKCHSYRIEEELNKKEIVLQFNSKFLLNEYISKNKSIGKIAKENNTSFSKVKRCLIKYGISTRSIEQANSKSINNNIFENLNASSSFLLGYIFTDGDLLLNLKTKQYFLRIYSKRKYLIENVKTILKAEAKIQSRGKQKHKEVNQSEMYFIHVGNQDVIKDLMELGMTLCKSDLIFPNVPKKYIHHFIRGVWAGSGCLSLNNNSLMSSITISSISFIESIENHLNAIGLKKRRVYKNKLTKRPSYVIKYATQESEKLYKFLYRGHSNLTICKRQKIMYSEYFGK